MSQITERMLHVVAVTPHPVRLKDLYRVPATPPCAADSDLTNCIAAKQTIGSRNGRRKGMTGWKIIAARLDRFSTYSTLCKIGCRAKNEGRECVNGTLFFALEFYSRDGKTPTISSLLKMYSPQCDRWFYLDAPILTTRLRLRIS